MTTAKLKGTYMREYNERQTIILASRCATTHPYPPVKIIIIIVLIILYQIFIAKRFSFVYIQKEYIYVH